MTGVLAPVPVPTTPDGVPLAGYGQRVGAYLIDTAITFVVSLLVGLPFGGSRVETSRFVDDSGNVYWSAYWSTLGDSLHHSALVTLPAEVVLLVYFVAMLRWKGATLGKLAVGLRIRLRESDGTLPWRAIALRLLVQFGLSWAALALVLVSPLLGFLVVVAVSVFGLLDDLWPLWDGKRQALHDKVARTNVVRTR